MFVLPSLFLGASETLLVLNNVNQPQNILFDKLIIYGEVYLIWITLCISVDNILLKWRV